MAKGTANSPEATAIQAAYESQIDVLFKLLVTNVGDGVADKPCADRFSKGLMNARKARQIALDVVAANP